MSITQKYIDSLPTEFRAVTWDDGWDFDMPCVVYFPASYARLEVVRGTGSVENAVDDICLNIVEGDKPNDRGLAQECVWRKWSKKWMGRRKRAWHATVRVRWFLDKDNKLTWEITSSKEKYGRIP